MLHQLTARRPWGVLVPLTRRELTVLTLMAHNLTRTEIGRELHLSRNTIKTHLRSIYSKLAVSSRRDAVRRARAEGLVTIDSPCPLCGREQ